MTINTIKSYLSGLLVSRNIVAAITLGLALTLTACQDGDWDEPSFAETPFGNNAITEDGLVTIAALKADPDFASAFKNSHLVFACHAKYRKGKAYLIIEIALRL